MSVWTMSGTMDWPGLIPLVFFVWVFAAVIAIGELAYSERRGALPARPMLTALRRWLVLGFGFTACGFLNIAYDKGLIAAWQLIAVVLVLMAVGCWLNARKA
jgi:hypothetical protein